MYFVFSLRFIWKSNTIVNLVVLLFSNKRLAQHSSARSEVNRKIIEKTLPKEQLIKILNGLLRTNADLGFLMKIDQSELETLVASIRDRVDSIGK